MKRINYRTEVDTVIFYAISGYISELCTELIRGLLMRYSHNFLKS